MSGFRAGFPSPGRFFIVPGILQTPVPSGKPRPASTCVPDSGCAIVSVTEIDHKRPVRRGSLGIIHRPERTDCDSNRRFEGHWRCDSRGAGTVWGRRNHLRPPPTARGGLQNPRPHRGVGRRGPGRGRGRHRSRPDPKCRLPNRRRQRPPRHHGQQRRGNRWFAALPWTSPPSSGTASTMSISEACSSAARPLPGK